MSDDSFENTEDKIKEAQKLDISIFKYFWQVNPLILSKQKTIPRFLRKIDVLGNFNDYELIILSKYLHQRDFLANEKIFKQYDRGIGFYMILSGSVDIYMINQEASTKEDMHLLNLESYNYFGELALLQDNHQRTASAITKDGCQLIGLFKPDMDDMIKEHPVVATKLLQSISKIMANRLFSVTVELQKLKCKIDKLEGSNESKK